MKQLIILTMALIGWASAAVAQTDNQPKQANNPTETQSYNGTATDYQGPKYVYGNPVFKRLEDKFGYKGKNLDVSYYMQKTGSLPKSKIQLIVDEGANVIDSSILVSSNLDKDKSFISVIKSSQLYDTPATINGEPCKSVVILTICYYPHGDFDTESNSYPLITLPDSEAETTASTDSIPSN